MEKSFKSFLILLAGVALLSGTLIMHLIFLEENIFKWITTFIGFISIAYGAYNLRQQAVGFLRGQRGEVFTTTIALIGIVLALGYLTNHFTFRLDMTKQGRYSLSESTINMLQRIKKPVHIVFFHDPMMRETDDLYNLIASYSDKVTIEFLDPMVNPAQARLRGIEFAGSALMESEDRTIRVHSPTEVDIANGILRVSQGKEQTACFIEGHGENDPFSLEHHDHFEGDQGHSHGLETKVVVHERHGMAKARHGLESMNYKVKVLRLLGEENLLKNCNLLVVAGPKMELRKKEIEKIDHYVQEGGNALFMLDPFIKTGLETVLLKLGVRVDDTLVIDEANHFWTDISAPAVTAYNRHTITEGLPLSFFMGARSLSPTETPVPGNSIKALINSSKRSFAETDKNKIDYEIGIDIPGPATIMVVVVRNPAFVDPTNLTITRADNIPEENFPKVISRVAVIGDADFATNSFFHILGNGNLFLNTINYLSAQEDLIGIEPKTYDLPRVNLTNRQMKGTFFLSMVLIPGLLSLIGFAVWWRQR